MLTKDNSKKEVVKREEEEQKLEFGEPYEQTRRKHSKFDFGENLQVVPVEIEIESLVYSLIKDKILENTGVDKVSFEEWEEGEKTGIVLVVIF